MGTPLVLDLSLIGTSMRTLIHLSILTLAAAAFLSAGGQKAAVGWALAFHVINSIGFANIFPVGLALYAGGCQFVAPESPG